MPSPTTAATRPRPYVAVALAMVAAHVAFRAWAVLGAWFYVDDYRLVDEARGASLGSRLLDPYDAQLMPWGRLLAWVGARPESLSWPLLASMSLLMASAAALACLWFLVTLFGWRRRTLAVLALYLTTAMTVPAFVWWAAALNQVPLQAVFFVAVAAWVRYLRGEGRRWLAVVALALAFGLCCYVKTLLVFPTLAFVAVGCFATGGPVHRVVTVVRRHWPVVLVAAAAGAGYLAYYLATVPQISDSGTPESAGELAEEMVGSSFTSALFGGPWRWDELIAPVGQADPPRVLVTLCWIAVALVVGYLALRRERTLRSWLFLAAYVAADYLLLLTTRAQSIGTISGTEYRYLTDAMCAVVLALGLATMELHGAEESSRERAEPVLTRRIGPLPVAVALVVVCAGGAWSTASYARIWHDRNPGKAFFTTARADLDGEERVDLANQTLPGRVTGALDPVYGSSRGTLPLLSRAARFPDVSDDLHVLAADGSVVPAALQPVTTTTPGPVPGCGWSVPAEHTLPLETRTVDRDWWLRIDYLASEDSGLSVTAGDTTRVANLRRGLHQLYVKVEGVFDDIGLGDTDDGVTVCVDRVLVGTMPEVGR